MERHFKLPDAGCEAYTAPSCEVFRIETDGCTMTTTSPVGTTIQDVEEEEIGWD